MLLSDKIKLIAVSLTALTLILSVVYCTLTIGTIDYLTLMH